MQSRINLVFSSTDEAAYLRKQQAILFFTMNVITSLHPGKLPKLRQWLGSEAEGLEAQPLHS